MFEVSLTKKSQKQLYKLDDQIKISCIRLLKELRINPFLGKLSETVYHAHIKYSWVAVWEVNKQDKTVTVTFIGSREDAPYGR